MSDKINKHQNAIEQDYRFKNAYEVGSAAIKRTLGKNASHEDYFALLVQMAASAVTGNGHLSLEESLHNSKCFGEQLAEIILNNSKLPENPSTPTQRLM